jgi:large subunit ribosomal protein L10
MNRDQKAVAIAEIASHIDASDAIFAVDYRGITVEQVAELRAKLRESDATFKVVKNSLTERAADQAGAESLKELLSGPIALTFVRGDVATAAKAIADYARATQLLPFKGGLMEGDALDVDQMRSLSRLPSRDVLYGQLVGVVASPVTGLVRSLGALIGGLAIALGQVNEKKQSGEIPAGEAPAAAPEPEAAPAAEEPPEELARAEETAAGPPPPEDKTEPENDQPAQADDKQTDVSAKSQPEDSETNPTKED